MTSRVSFAGLAGMMLAFLALAYAGCGQSSPSDRPKTEDQIRDEAKIRELSKKGYDFNEIRSIMNGEEPKPKSPTKKKSGGSRR
jgi:hypothetical protein